MTAEEREYILESIAKLRPEWVENEYDRGYSDALYDVICMISLEDDDIACN